jgi:hypothetical protein
VRGVSLGSLATSQLLLKSGKRTPGGQLILPRIAANLVTHPQSYQWEQLKAPLAAESFAQLSARLELLPPSCLRPRRCTENLHVVSVQSADKVRFDVANQQLAAVLRDSEGRTAELAHPYHARADLAFSQLSQSLNERGNELRFVSGHVRIRDKKLQIRPVALVFDGPKGRQGILPCIESVTLNSSHQQVNALARQPIAPEARRDDAARNSHLTDYLAQFEDQVAELLITGLKNAQPAPWKELDRVGQSLGFARLTQPITELERALIVRLNQLRWDPVPAIQIANELCLLCRLAYE